MSFLSNWHILLANLKSVLKLHASFGTEFVVRYRVNSFMLSRVCNSDLANVACCTSEATLTSLFLTSETYRTRASEWSVKNGHTMSWSGTGVSCCSITWVEHFCLKICCLSLLLAKQLSFCFVLHRMLRLARVQMHCLLRARNALAVAAAAAVSPLARTVLLRRPVLLLNAAWHHRQRHLLAGSGLTAAAAPAGLMRLAQWYFNNCLFFHYLPCLEYHINAG